jgi:hypothetical protein
VLDVWIVLGQPLQVDDLGREAKVNNLELGLVLDDALLDAAEVRFELSEDVAVKVEEEGGAADGCAEDFDAGCLSALDLDVVAMQMKERWRGLLIEESAGGQGAEFGWLEDLAELAHASVSDVEGGLERLRRADDEAVVEDREWGHLGDLLADGLEHGERGQRVEEGAEH